MADDLKNKTISKNNSGFPDYLDFNKLRSAAIEYLGNLSGKIWTDHNVHDPGITILESLIYALLDLGYRTNLPVTDLFTRDPNDKTKDNNFFTPAEILGNNPLTITDYRKLLVDITGVKNAWLEIDKVSPVVFCPPDNNDPAAGNEGNQKGPCDCDVLNGLYHVYVQLEDGINTKHKKEAVILKIKQALMAHRNLCEDFIDIHVLCNLEIGLCVEIELEPGADAENVYVKMVEVLEEYFSPSPKFYSLQQLLDKKKTIDEIFAGRPYNVMESHGFIDTDEFEQLTLRKELHLSDVYHLLFDIDGISNVRNLGWITCCDDKKSVQKWKLQLPENYIPSFSTTCSGIVFTRNGLPLQADLKKFESFFELKRSGQQKALYTEPSSFLDPEFPTGVYRNDLADYYSIQNDFPKVYGISEGSLPTNATVKRKAQALQLQSFLLFFDQLLANYLTQLKNIRSLFAFSSSHTGDGDHTYFINQLTDAPQLQKLLRFRNEAGADNALGTEGSILAYPTSRKKIQQLIDAGTLQNTDLERKCKNAKEKDFPEYEFCFAAVRDQAVNQLKDDLLIGEYEPVVVSNNDDCWFFYIMTSSPDFALISKRYYRDSKAASDAAASIKYIATFTENYRSFMGTCCENSGVYFSFDIDFNLDAYAKYLQLIVEDKVLYASRRQDFLTHLLSRFAERFTDFALLSAPFLTGYDLEIQQIKAEERFLENYPDLSSNRGKAYDYLKNKWGNYNISGFEKRFKALAGIENWKRHYLCNFVVEKGDALYQLTISFFNQAFAVDNKIVKEEEALASFRSVYKKLGDPVFQLRYIDHEQQWQVFIEDDFGNQYGSKQLFAEETKAVDFSNTLSSVFNFRPEFSRDIFVSKYIYKDLFTDHAGVVIAESKEHFIQKEVAEEYNNKISEKMVSFLNNPGEFTKVNDKIKLDKLLVVSKDNFPYIFIDERQFIFKDTDFIHLKEEKKKFSALNKIETIQFDSIHKYDNVKYAKDGYRHLLILLYASGNYTVELNKQTELYEIFVNNKGEKFAIYFDSFSSADIARKKVNEIVNEINSYSYRLYTTDPLPDEWEFKYRSEDLSGNIIDYISDQNYTSEDEVWQGAKDFYSNIPSLEVRTIKTKLALVLNEKNIRIHCVADIENPDENKIAQAKQILAFSQELFNKVNKPTDKAFMQLLVNNRVNIDEDYVYKLVDKDNVLASCVIAFNNGTDADKAKNDLITKAIAGYNYIDIATAGNILEIKDAKTKIKWYHYQVKCNNRKYQQGPLTGQDLVLFESTRGYASSDEAMTAFNSEYLLVLKYARVEKNYGPGQFISMEEILVHTNDACDNSKSIVFVTKETSDELGGYEVQKELIPLAASYPIRYIRKNKYRFVIGEINDAAKTFELDWRSNALYRTAQEAMQQFQFFLMLLKYGGNFYVEKSPTDCNFHIYIREVLAISAHGFATPDDAWGPRGIEKFICTAQSESGFHNYLNRLNCSNSFFVACGNAGLIHPCIYETPERRDIALNNLYKVSSFNFFDLLEIVDAETIILHDLEHKPLARIFTNRQALNYFRCDWLVAFIESVYNDSNYIKKEKTFQLNYRYRTDKQETYYKIAEPFDSTTKLKEWKILLQKIACYFPVIRKDDACGSSSSGKKKYFVEIRLPGFGCSDEHEDDPCFSPCENASPCEDPGCKIGCYVAWKSDCCFDDCCDALSFYARSLSLLNLYENYKPVYDCTCNSYRIGLYPQLTLKGEEQFPVNIRKFVSRVNTVCDDRAGDSNHVSVYRKNPFYCLNEIVAINPQGYDNEQAACRAVARAKKCINSEGLHLVEHILLRPRCKEENNPQGKYIDCGCPGLPEPCMDGSICHFQWKPGGDVDPCDEIIPVCFTPGCDPYSFISTIALPAWPERFRSESARKNVEKLLQREAPAHVLLRILWLNPRDFCCFEYYFKTWTEWMAQKLCGSYSNCDFLIFLFKKRYDPLYICEECTPCSCDSDQPPSCFDQPQDLCSDMVTKLNQLFCWSQSPTYDFTHCQPQDEIIFLEEGANHLAEIGALAIAEPHAVAAPAIAHVEENKTITEEKKAEPDRKEKFKLVQSRAHNYETHIRKVIERNPDNKVAANALIFLKKSKPTPEEFASFAEEVIRDKTNKSKKMKGLSKADKQVIIQNITWKYLDSVCFNGKDISKIIALKDTIALLKKNKIETNSLYEKWESEKVREFEPSIDFKKIKNSLHGG